MTQLDRLNMYWRLFNHLREVPICYRYNQYDYVLEDTATNVNNLVRHLRLNPDEFCTSNVDTLPPELQEPLPARYSQQTLNFNDEQQ